jgi:uncharacterized protein YfdQ (DUF2303 family)
MNEPGNAAEIIKFAKEHLGSKLDTVSAPVEGLPEDVPYLVLPTGQKVCSLKSILEEWRENPVRVNGVSQAQTLDSFIDSINRFKGPSSAVFCDWTAPSIQVVFDYHRAEDDGDRARWCQHRCVYSFPFSEQWKAWSEISGAELSQRDFAEFIEDHLDDVADPAKAGETAKGLMEMLELSLASPSKVLALSRGLSIRENIHVAEQVALSSGEVQFTLQSEHTDGAGQKLCIPRAFLVGVPVFLGRERGYPIPVRLRYRLPGGKVTWILILHEADKYIRDAVQEDASRVAAETKLPLFWGSPEA